MLVQRSLASFSGGNNDKVLISLMMLRVVRLFYPVSKMLSRLIKKIKQPVNDATITIIRRHIGHFIFLRVATW